MYACTDLSYKLRIGSKTKEIMLPSKLI